MNENALEPRGEFLLYQTEDGRTKLDVWLEDQTLWLNQKQLTDLFGKAKGTISEHSADASHLHMGLTSFTGVQPRRSDVVIAKNYLDAEELEMLNRIVVAYLEFAELQALGRRSMTMVAWIQKLDDFLKLGDHDVLTHTGRVSAEVARLKAEAEYENYRQQLDVLPAPVEVDMIKALESTANVLLKQKGKKK